MCDKKDHPKGKLEQTFSVFEVAKRHRVTPKTIRNEIDRRRLEAIYVGRLLRITAEALAAWERGDWK
ncbi:MAG: helix-turn-helix domain-containing protein [Hyphomicrobiaceae bacterium]